MDDIIMLDDTEFLILKEQCTPGGSEYQTSRTDKKDGLSFK